MTMTKEIRDAIRFREDFYRGEWELKFDFETNYYGIPTYIDSKLRNVVLPMEKMQQAKKENGGNVAAFIMVYADDIGISVFPRDKPQYALDLSDKEKNEIENAMNAVIDMEFLRKQIADGYKFECILCYLLCGECFDMNLTKKITEQGTYYTANFRKARNGEFTAEIYLDRDNTYKNLMKKINEYIENIKAASADQLIDSDFERLANVYKEEFEHADFPISSFFDNYSWQENYDKLIERIEENKKMGLNW